MNIADVLQEQEDNITLSRSASAYDGGEFDRMQSEIKYLWQKVDLLVEHIAVRDDGMRTDLRASI